MHRKTFVIVMAPLVFPTSLLRAQTPCPTIPVVVNSPEDKLMLDYNGADKPQDQVAALKKFAQEHADSRYLPCVNEYLTVAFLKFEDAVQEIFAVQVLPQIRFPDLINDDPQILSDSFVLPDEALNQLSDVVRPGKGQEKM